MRKTFKLCLSGFLLFAILTTGFFAGNGNLAAVFSENMPVSGTTIVLDAGHGGEDGGAVSPNGIRESDLNLQITLRLDDLFHLLGRKTYLIRDKDAAVYTEGAKTISEKKVSDLKNRVRMVGEIPNALVVSIHQNMFQDPKYSGMQVFYAQTEGSLELAEQLQGLVPQFLDPGNHRQVKPSEAVYFMKHISCTGVLVECGFLSNETECEKLCSAAYQKQISLLIASGITEYLGRVNTNENENRLSMHGMRKRNTEMAGEMSGLRCLEYAEGVYGIGRQRLSL